MAGYDLIECLRAIDPASCSYQEWLEVGMALHAEGHAVEEWDAWSARDARRHHPGECGRKWATFDGGSGGAVRGGTIVEMARRSGWRPDASDEPQGWGAILVEEVRPIDAGFIERQDVEPPSDEDWERHGDIARYVRALFRPGEHVCVVTDSYRDDDGKFKPVGQISFERDYLLGELERYGENLRNSIGDYDERAGAWVCFNPLDGQGRGNKNVTAYRYALVESDEVPKDRQRGMIEALGLPVAAMVDSGGKSVHAIVRVDAPDLEEYRRRVNLLYDYCSKKGFAVDQQNKNPSRLSRLPGVVRSGGKQWLMMADERPTPWAEWVERVADETDGMPDTENLSDVFADMPRKAPTVIGGVLRQGHKMLLSGPSKAGKSFALIELCVAFASGGTWFGKRCAQGPVLYVNLEIDGPSCAERFQKVFQGTGTSDNYSGNITVWNLRGKSCTLDKLAPRIVRRAKKMNKPIAIIIDPIYKVMTGDENSASDMGAFCNQFDYIAKETGASVIYCHHQSKGVQGQKNAMDRASGSGVFARDPDAMVDMTEIDMATVDEGVRMGHDGTPFEVTWITREYKTPVTQKMWFDYPVHVDGTDDLKDAAAKGSAKACKRAKDEAAKKSKAEKTAKRREVCAQAYDSCIADGVSPTRIEVARRACEIWPDMPASAPWWNANTTDSRNEDTGFVSVNHGSGKPDDYWLEPAGGQ